MNTSESQTKALSEFRSLKSRLSAPGAADVVAKEANLPLEKAEGFVRKVLSTSESDFLAQLAPNPAKRKGGRLNIADSAQQVRAGVAYSPQAVAIFFDSMNNGVSMDFDDGVWLIGF